MLRVTRQALVVAFICSGIGAFITAFSALGTEQRYLPSETMIVAQELNIASLVSTIAKNWAPLDTKQQRWRAITSAEQGLAALHAPNIALFVDKTSLAKHLQTAFSKIDLKSAGLKLQDPVLSFREQGVDVHVGFQFPIGSVKVVGEADGTLSLAISGTRLDLLPAFSTVRISSVDTGNQLVNAGLVTIVNAGLSEFLKALNVGAQNAVKPIPLEIPPIAPIDVAAQLRTMPGVIYAEAKPISVTVALSEAVALINEDGLTVIAELVSKPGSQTTAPVQPPQNLDDATIAQNFRSFSGKFNVALDAAFPDLPKIHTPWVAITKTLVTSVAGAEVSNAEISATYRLANFSTSFKSGPIQPFNYEGISCPLQQDARDCSLRPCTLPTDTRDCSQPHDERSCGICGDVPCPTFGQPFRTCRKCAPDPVCETAKATQNAIYAANKAACESAKGAQNGIYQSQFVACQTDSVRLKGQCEAEKAGQNAAYASIKATCEAGKEAVKRLQLVGPIGEVHGDVHAAGQFNVKIANIRVDPGLQSLSAKISVGGTADLSGNLGFQPYNAGVVICVFPWQEPFRTTATIPSQELTEAVIVHMSNGVDHVDVELEVQSQALKFNLRPTPVEALFIAHPQVALNCSLVTAAVGAGNAVQPLTGDMLGGATSGNFDQSIPTFKLEMSVPSFRLPIANQEMVLIPQIRNAFILFHVQ